MTMTRGKKSSEKKACYVAFFGSFILGSLGLFKGADLSALGVLVGAVNLPLMWYAGMRTANKIKNGETQE
jgi:hypothetical protein